MTTIFTFEVEWENLPTDRDPMIAAHVTLAGVRLWTTDGAAARSMEQTRGQDADERIMSEFADVFKTAIEQSVYKTWASKQGQGTAYH